MMHISKVYPILCFLVLFAVSRDADWKPDTEDELRQFIDEEILHLSSSTMENKGDGFDAKYEFWWGNDCNGFMNTEYIYNEKDDFECVTDDTIHIKKNSKFIYFAGKDVENGKCHNIHNIAYSVSMTLTWSGWCAKPVFPGWAIVMIISIGIVFITAVVSSCFCRKKNKKITPAMNQHMYPQQQIYNQKAQPYNQQQPYSQPQHYQQQPQYHQQQPQYHQQQPQYHQQQSYEVHQHQPQVVET